jgi:hypothetical protein
LPVDAMAVLPSMVPVAMNYEIPDGIYGVRRKVRPVRRLSGVPSASEKRLAADEVLVEIAKSLKPKAMEAMQRRHGLTLVQSQKLRLTGTTVFLYRIADKRPIAAVVRELEADAAVASAQPNYIFTLRQDQRGKDAKQPEFAELRGKQSQADSRVDAPGAGPRSPDAADASATPDHTGSVARLVVRDGRLAVASPEAPISSDAPSQPARSGMDGKTFDILKALDVATTKDVRAIGAGLAGPVDPAIGRSLDAAGKRDMGLVADDSGTKPAPLDTAVDVQR